MIVTGDQRDRAGASTARPGGHIAPNPTKVRDLGVAESCRVV